MYTSSSTKEKYCVLAREQLLLFHLKEAYIYRLCLCTFISIPTAVNLDVGRQLNGSLETNSICYTTVVQETLLLK